MVHGFPWADSSHKLSLVIFHFGVLGVLLVKHRLGLLVDQDESELDIDLRRLGPRVDPVIAVLAEELDGALVDTDQRAGRGPGVGNSPPLALTSGMARAIRSSGDARSTNGVLQ